MEPDVLINFGLMTAERLSEIYGEVFSKLVRESVADFITKKAGGQVPRLETLEEAASYVRSKIEKYPMGHCAFWYGIGKAESQLQGSAGPATRLYLRDIVQRMTQLDGINEMVGKIDSTTTALEQFKKVAVTMELLDENSFQCNGDDNSAELRIMNCPNGDGCKQMMAEGVIQTGSLKPICTISLGSTVTAEIVTKTPHDHKMLELNPPNCVGRVFRI
jgi:hypothetical protein